jgi:NADP-dependent 3-hydroxy acid dehydrogenase YdfG
MIWSLITGASSGIGAAAALKLAKQGHNVWLVARREDRLKRLCDTIRAEGGRADYSVLDVADGVAVEDFASKNADRLAQVGVLLNNAGLAKGIDPFHSSSEANWRAMLETNVIAVLRLTRLVLPHMIKREAGHIVNIGSVAGRWAYPGGNVYSASKSALHMFNESLRLDLLGTGIRVTEILPGMADTEFSEVRLGDKERAKAVYKGLKALTADDVAEAVAWSLSRPAHVNIQEIVLYPTQQAAPGHVSRS